MLLRQISLFLTTAGLLISLNLCAISGVQTYSHYPTTPQLNVGGVDAFHQWLVNYSSIALCFLAVLVFVKIDGKFLPKLLSIIILAFTLSQLRLLFLYKLDLWDHNWEYGAWLRASFYIDLGLLGFVATLL